MKLTVLLLLMVCDSFQNYAPKKTFFEYQKGVISFFVDNGFLDDDFLQRWERLAVKQESGRITTHEMYRLISFNTRINNAARRYQTEYGLIVTGVVDGKIMEIVFGEDHSKGLYGGLF